ncbi:hypothetical protein ZWY2020_017735 [Hordeum vulgare]|nr:hypothetical protein ZWY2020_017735 [Hordeum vulgare]
MHECGAIDYPSFLTLLKQLIPPLSTQLADRRSTIVKQACHLLNVLSKELLGDFEPCAEQFIPMLFKLVVITVLVIAESSDTCTKTILQNCKVARILPRVADIAKNDRSAILRARCCEYALLILEYWADAPEIQRSADLYEDLIKCCVADAMSESLRPKEEDLQAFYRRFVRSRIQGVRVYGPTGSGKSHNMFGCARQPDIVYRALRDILDGGGGCDSGDDEDDAMAAARRRHAELRADRTPYAPPL